MKAENTPVFDLYTQQMQEKEQKPGWNLRVTFKDSSLASAVDIESVITAESETREVLQDWVGKK